MASTSFNNAATAVGVVTVGIDIGSETTKVVLGSAQSCEIVRTDTGLHCCPTAVSFQGSTRHMGETAVGKNKITCLNRLLMQTHHDDFLQDYYPFVVAKNEFEETVVTVDYHGQQTAQFSASAVLGMLLGSIQKSVLATLHRLAGSTSSEATPHLQYFLSVPPDSSPEFCQQVLDAAFAAGLESAKLVESSVAYASNYHRKFPHFGIKNDDEDESIQKTCLVVDMGHGQTSVSLSRFGLTSDDEKKENNDEEEAVAATVASKAPFTILASKSSPTLGAASVDVKLWQHFQSTNSKLSHVAPNTKAGQRLLEGCHKLKHLLSQLSEGSVTVESVGENDTDVVLTATRHTLADLCMNEAAALKQLVQDVLLESGVDHVTAVEIVGGGCRIPWVQAAIQDVVGADKTLSKSLDDTSSALGAALVGESDFVSDWVVTMAEVSESTLHRRKALREAEIAMEELDQQEKTKSSLRNKMESMVLELRSAKHGKHGSLLPSDNLDAYLNDLDDWLISKEVDTATLDAMKTKFYEVNGKIQEMCSEYYDAIDKEQRAKEKDMEEEAKRAKLEEAANGDVDEEDHDNRRLPKKRRMEIVMKNKNEATELFKDGNWKFAAARYTKALSHCAKFVDLSPEDTKEVNELKVTLNLNLALAYTKMDNLDQALRCSNEALSLTDDNPKAFYRRASVYFEKKRWDDAKADISKAKKLAGEDKAITKLEQQIDMQLKKQKMREKKMAAKMFG